MIDVDKYKFADLLKIEKIKTIDNFREYGILLLIKYIEENILAEGKEVPKMDISDEIPYLINSVLKQIKPQLTVNEQGVLNKYYTSIYLNKVIEQRVAGKSNYDEEQAESKILNYFNQNQPLDDSTDNDLNIEESASDVQKVMYFVHEINKSSLDNFSDKVKYYVLLINLLILLIQAEDDLDERGIVQQIEEEKLYIEVQSTGLRVKNKQGYQLEIVKLKNLLKIKDPITAEIDTFI